MDTGLISRLPLGEQLQAGRALRGTIPRRDHATLHLPTRDPLALLESQHAGRVPDLVPIRVGRMLQSPFTFYRGSAAQMAHDLRGAPRTDLLVAACGDAHLSNFGYFASPERRLMFDLNDFDEVNIGPWEWDLKRLAASVILAGRDVGIAEDACLDAAIGASRGYRDTLERLYGLTALERFYFRVESDLLVEGTRNAQDRKVVRKAERKARRRSADRVLGTITTEGEARDLHIVDQPPVLRHLGVATEEEMRALVAAYRSSAAPDIGILLEQYTLADAAFRVVGVGSVGLRAHVVLLVGPAGEPLVLQAKEAVASALVSHGGMPFARSGQQALTPPTTAREAWRVVTGQRIMQSVSDRFLGWFSFRGRDFYVRQFRDMKGALDLAALTPSLLADYARLCAGLLARAHAQSPAGAQVHGYVRGGESLDAAIGAWARAYADLTEADHALLTRAVRDGRLASEEG